MIPPDPWLFWIAATLAAIAVGFSKGGVPGIGVLGVPILALAISPVSAAAILLPIFVVTDVFGLWAYRHNFDRRNLLILMPATTLGVGIGWATASFVSDWLVTLLVALIGLAYCYDSWAKRHRLLDPRPADVPRGALWGTIAGFTSFVSHAGAPPYQMYVLPQRLEKLVYAGTTTILFAVVNAVKLVPYWALGQFSATNLKTAVVLVPPAIAATLLGVRVVRAVSQDAFYKFVMISLFLVSLKLLFDAVTGFRA